MVSAPFCRRLFRLASDGYELGKINNSTAKYKKITYICRVLNHWPHKCTTKKPFLFLFFSPQSIFEIPSTLRIEFLIRKYFLVLILLKSYRIPFAGLDSWISTGISAIRPSKSMHLQVYVLFLPSPRLTTSLPSWILSTLISPILFFMLIVSCHLHYIFYVYRMTVLWSPQLKYLIPNILLFNYIFS